MLEVFADLGLNLSVGQRCGRRDEYSMKTLILVCEASDLGGLEKGCQFTGYTQIKQGTEPTLLIASAEADSTFQPCGFTVLSIRIFAASRTLLVRI